jgi:heat shock protein HtpX
MTSFFDEISRNRIKSIILMLIFGALFTAVVYLFVLFLGGGILGLFVGLLIVIAYAIFTYYAGDKLVLKISGAKEADRRQYGNLYDIVEGITAVVQIPMPKVYIINDPNPNAFATGRNKKLSAIAVTTGLLSLMDRNELEAVISHEASHISNNDIQFMMVAIVFAGAIGIFAAYIRNILWFGVGVRRDERGNTNILLLIALLIGLLAPLIALLIRLAISRRREYMADANGARITRDPRSLASALRKIQKYTSSPNAQPVRHANEITASLYFSNPFKLGSIQNLFSTHPPIEDRIYRLEHMY